MRTAKKEDKATIIKRLAFDLFLEKGFDGTSVRDICKAADIEAPTLYYYFNSKNGLFLALIEEMYQNYLERMKKLDAIDRLDNPLEKLKLFFIGNLRYAMENMDEVKFYYRYKSFFMGEMEAEIQDYVARMKEVREHSPRMYMQQALEAGMVSGDLNKLHKIYMKLVNANCFEIVVENWRPNVEEMNDLWQRFCRTELMSVNPSALRKDA